MAIFQSDDHQKHRSRPACHAARAFYGGILGITEVPKPPDLAKRGGVWFERGSLKVHLGIEQDFRPAKKAHIAFAVADLGALAEALKTAGFDTIPAEPLDGRERAYSEDCFGNRLELIQA